MLASHLLLRLSGVAVDIGSDAPPPRCVVLRMVSTSRSSTGEVTAAGASNRKGLSTQHLLSPRHW